MAGGQKWCQAPYSPLGSNATHDLHVFHILEPFSGTEGSYWGSLRLACWKARSKDTAFLRRGNRVLGNISHERGWRSGSRWPKS